MLGAEIWYGKNHYQKLGKVYPGVNAKGAWGVAMGYCYETMLSIHSEATMTNGKNAKPAEGTRHRFSVISN